MHLKPVPTLARVGIVGAVAFAFIVTPSGVPSHDSVVQKDLAHMATLATHTGQHEDRADDGARAGVPSTEPTVETPLAGTWVYPAKEQLSDGGLLYRYELPDGSVMEVTVPGPTFDPLSASDGELARFGFPERPSDPDQLNEWTQLMSDYKYSDVVPDDPFFYPSDDSALHFAPQYTNWSG